MTSTIASVTPAAAEGDHINLIDANRANSPRSSLIAEKVEQVKADWESGNYDTLMVVLQQCIPLDLMDLGVTTFNLVRIPFQTRRPVADTFVGCTLPTRFKLTNAWNIFQYFTDTLGNWDKFREFLELADKVRQLATAYCTVSEPHIFWVEMDRLWSEARPEPSATEENQDGSLWYPRRCVTAIVRNVLMKNLRNNPVEQQPTDSEGEPINQQLFHDALRMNWEEERAQRSMHLLNLHSRGTIDISESRAILREWNGSWQPINEFHWAVLRARGSSICARMNLNEMQEGRLLAELQWMENYRLGVQGYALCLPQEGEDYYDPRFLTRMTRNRRRMATFFSQMDRDDANFSDGWFQRFPAALPPLRG